MTHLGGRIWVVKTRLSGILSLKLPRPGWTSMAALVPPRVHFSVKKVLVHFH